MFCELIQIVTNYFGEIKNQLKICQLNKNIYNYVHIYSLYKDPYIIKVNQNILMQSKFSELTKLNVNNNPNVTNISHLNDTLKYLKCGNTIDEKQVMLSFEDGGFYVNTHDFFGKCAIDQVNISKLTKLKTLHCNNNEKINNINHLFNTLEELDCSGPYCGIKQEGINKLCRLVTIDVSDNNKISNLDNVCDTLKYLKCNSVYGTKIEQKNIIKLTNLVELTCRCNGNINNVNHLADTLEYLDFCYNNNIRQNGIDGLKKIKYLFCNTNSYIVDLNHLNKSLKVLVCQSCAVTQQGIAELTNLECFDCSYCNDINNIDHMSNNLRYLIYSPENQFNESNFVNFRKLSKKVCSPRLHRESIGSTNWY